MNEGGSASNDNIDTDAAAAAQAASIETKRRVLAVANSAQRRTTIRGGASASANASASHCANTHANQHIHTNTDLTDAVMLLSLFSQPGMVRDFSNAGEFAFDHSTVVDDRSGRIVQAYIGYEATLRWRNSRELAHLQRLHTLTLDKCASATLVRDLGALGNLTRLTLRSCTIESVEGFLDGLQKGSGGSGGSNSNSNSNSNCSNNGDCRFRNTLKDLTIRDCGLTEAHLEVLLLDAIPRLPALTGLDVYDNQIRSFRSIADRIARLSPSPSPSSSPPPSSTSSFPSVAGRNHGNLCTLLFAGNPVDRWYRTPTEAAALRTILGAFPRLSRVTHGSWARDYPDMEYVLRVRYAGRELVEGQGRVDPRVSVSVSVSVPVPVPVPVPASAWPFLLERAQGWNRRFGNDGDGNCTGVYYLLRCGPALHC